MAGPKSSTLAEHGCETRAAHSTELCHGRGMGAQGQMSKTHRLGWFRCGSDVVGCLKVLRMEI